MKFGRRELDLSSPKIMGVLNVTPDSFFDGGRFTESETPLTSNSDKIDIDACLRAAEQMCLDGAHIIDVGGESTRPKAARVSSQQEQDRVLPVIEKICERLDVIVSVDTSNPVVISQATALGAGLINDVRALTREGALEAAAKTGLPICLMHMQGSPQTMQNEPSYDDVVSEVVAYLNERARACSMAGINADRIIFDPGIGFGKTLEHNKALLLATAGFREQGLSVLIGVSRKSMIGKILNYDDPQDRLFGSLALAYDQFARGVNILRVHDVRETSDILKVFQFLHNND